MKADAVKKSSWIVTLCLAGIALVYLVQIWRPSRREIREIREQVRSRRQFVTRAAGSAKILTASQKKLETARRANRRWLDAAPRNRDLPGLYGKITALARRSGLVLTRFDPEQFNVYEELREMPVSVGCSGTFSQLFAFLREIESLPTALWVDFLRLEKTSGNGGIIKCELNLVVFSSNPYISDCILRAK